MNPQELTIQLLSDLYRKRDLSPVEVTQRLLDNISTKDGSLNSYATITAEVALEQAKIAERQLTSGKDRGPLHGIPINLKDNILTAGIPTEVGSPIMRGNVPTVDAEVVTRLKSAGSVLLGKTNLFEFTFGVASEAIGITKNPWNPEHTVNGSSSGSAASLAAGLTFGSVGSDTGGSIRIPSSYCGIVGFKPTYGLASLKGVFSSAWSMDHVGPMTRSVYDNAALLSAISDYRVDPTAYLSPAVAGLRIGVREMGDEISDEVQAGIESVTKYLEEHGAIVTRNVQIPILGDVSKVLMGVLLPEASAAHEELIGKHAKEYHSAVRGLLEMGSLISAVDYIRAQRYRKRFCREVNEAISDFDVLILPTTVSPPPREDETMDLDALTRFTGPFDVTGLPALSLPTGVSPSGLPLGMQIVGKAFAEDVVYQVAAVCEEATGCKGQIAAAYRG